MEGSAKWPVIITILLFSITAKSQKIFFEQLTTAEGLPSDYVNTVFKDSKGFLWIGTDKGACRYDGRQFLYLNKDNGLTSNFVYCFAEDPEGNIWIGTIEGVLCKYDGKTVTNFGFDKTRFSNIRQIYFNTDKSFFLTTSDHLYYCRSEKDAPERVRDCSFQILPLGKDLFITGNSKSIYLLKKINHDLVLRQSPRQDFFFISNGQMLVKEENSISSFTTDGEKFFQQNEFKFTKNKLPVSRSDIKQFFVNGDELLVATVNGLIYADSKNNELFLNSSSGLGTDFIRNIYKDDLGNIYICTYGAGIKIWPPRFYLQEYKIDGKVTSIFPAGSQTYITTTKKIYRHDPHPGSLAEFPGINGGNFTSIYKDGSGRIFIGTLNNFFNLPSDHHLQLLNDKNKSQYSVPANFGISGSLVKDNSLFTSAYGDGLMRFDNPANLHHGGVKLGQGIVEFLIPLKNSFATLSYSSGLTLYNDSGLSVQITSKEKLLSNTVYSVFREKENELWIGTSKGLNLYDGKQVVKTFSNEQGLIGTKVICIFRDVRQRLWVLSDKYLHLLENDKLRAIRSHPVLYDSRNSINRAVYDVQNDFLYIGLNDALLTVDLKKIESDSSIQHPKLVAVSVDTVKFNPTDKDLMLSHPAGKITFSFGQEFHSIAQKTDLYYKLAGFDEEWRQLNNSTEAVYSKLPAGNYELIAKTTGPDGYTSSESTLLRLEVLPPLWKRTWFIAVTVCILLAGFFYTGHRISKKRYRQKLLHIQEEYRMQVERERIAMELHDNVGSQLTYLINKIDDDYPLLSDKNEADKLSHFARGTMQELRETIWALDKKEIKAYDLENKLIQLAELYPAGKIKTQFNWNDHHKETVSLKSLQALNIYRIIQESLNNAVKHGKAESISINVEMKNGHLHVEIADCGKGFNPEVPGQGYGLRNMKNRAGEMNALLDIKSSKDNGTIVSLSVPIS